jgi:hypothetical protein
MEHRYWLEEQDCVLDRHLENLVNVFPFVANLKRFPVVALSATYLTGNVDVWQKMHFDPNYAVTLAGFAAATLNVKTETSRLIAARS